MEILHRQLAKFVGECRHEVSCVPKTLQLKNMNNALCYVKGTNTLFVREQIGILFLMGNVIFFIKIKGCVLSGPSVQIYDSIL